jgi:hypothetical protein
MKIELMKENLRLIFSLAWVPATGALIASTLIVIISMGDHVDYLLWSLGAWIITTVGTVVTSLD